MNNGEIQQVGYFRALHGIASVINMDRLSKDLDKECRSALKVSAFMSYQNLSRHILSCSYHST